MVFEDWELKFMKKHGLPGNLQTPRMIKTTKRKLQEQIQKLQADKEELIVTLINVCDIACTCGKDPRKAFPILIEIAHNSSKVIRKHQDSTQEG